MGQETPNSVVPITFSTHAPAELVWQRELYEAQCAIVLPRNIVDHTTFDDAFGNLTLVIKLLPFKTQFRVRMLSSLVDNPSKIEQETEILGAVVHFNVFTAKVNRVEDFRRQSARLVELRFLSEQSQGEMIWNTLTQEEQDLFRNQMEEFLRKSICPALKTQYAGCSLHPNFATQALFPEDFDPKRLLPFGTLFPNILNIEATIEGRGTQLDDLYCVNPTCACTDVLCLLTDLHDGSGPERPTTGFRYDVVTRQTGSLTQFAQPANLEATLHSIAEQFPLDLHFMLAARQGLIRKATLEFLHL